MATTQKAEKPRTIKEEATNGQRKSKNDEKHTPLSNGIEKKNDEKTKKKIKEDITINEDSLSSYQIPMSRVSRIIKTQDPSIRITQEAVYIINKASEKFLQVFTTEAYANAFLERNKCIDYKHLSSVVSKRRRFDFLSDFVPEKVKAEDAMVELQAVEN
ncbi:DNA polymerase II subunit B3-1-like [Bidens hawaiensis]|uniref:DNA polymerase II subunit B3-1-like n=1 Tax=Bidens hawaiensis TaxID=980011 RepID=UPI00404A7762